MRPVRYGRGMRVPAQLLGLTTLVATAVALWLVMENRSLRAELDRRPRPQIDGAERATGSARPSADASGEARSARIPSGSAAVAAPEPKLPETTNEQRLDRRQRRLAEFAEMFGRKDGETDDEYRSRIGPLIVGGLAMPRMRVADYRRIAEQKAGVTPEQSRQLDQAFQQTYDEVLEYTNKAIADGLLSPYERNVTGWLEFAGGLGGMLGDVQGQLGKILSPEQLSTMKGAGFEWGEYLGATAPWEQLAPPPPRR